jgi:hypothetical protein
MRIKDASQPTHIYALAALLIGVLYVKS